MVPKPTHWGPYRNEGEAGHCLGAFAANVVGPGAGVIFCDGLGASYLKRPFRDVDGSGLVLVVTAGAGASSQPANDGGGTWKRIEHFFSDAFAEIGKAEMAQADAQRAVGEAELQMIKQGWSSTQAFVTRNKTWFDGAATAGDAIGIIALVGTAIAIGAGAVTVLPAALAVAAGLASLALITRDGQLFWAELKGNQARATEIETSPYYRTIELVGTLLILPDLVVNAPRALVSLSKTSTELAEATEVTAHSGEALNAQREAVAAYQEAHVGKLKRPNIMTKVQRQQARANRLARDLAAAQEKLEKAQAEFNHLRRYELPPYAASLYSAGMAPISPPYLADPAHWHDAPPAAPPPAAPPLQCTPLDPHGNGDYWSNSLRFLMPDTPTGFDLSNSRLGLQVAISRPQASTR
jgi:hypothetical protein